MMRALLSHHSPAGPEARLSILIFHRVHASPDPLFPGELDVAGFERLCSWLASWFRVLPLAAAVRQLREGCLPARAACITFDDGYADNLTLAAPVLHRHHLPATVFVASGFVDGGRMFNDTVIEAMRRVPGDSVNLDDLGVELPLAGRRIPMSTSAQRTVAIEGLLKAIKYLQPNQRDDVVRRVVARCGSPRLPDDLMMSTQQLRALASFGIEVGAHTRTHPILARLDNDAASRELAGSKRDLEAMLDRPVPLFAYPNGKPNEDYSFASVELARQAGFDAAMSTAWGAAARDSDCFQLPRFTPWDRTRMRFGLRMVGNLRRRAAVLHARAT